MRDSKPMVDTNILVYAHNQDSQYFAQAKALLTDLINDGGFSVSDLILFEFFSVITNGRKIDAPLNSETAIYVITDMIESQNIAILQDDDDHHFFQWLRQYINTTKRYQIYDASIAYVMFQNEITELYTNNIKDFKKFDFIKAINPFAPSSPSSKPRVSRFIPYGRQSIDEQDVAAVCSVLRSDWLTTGPKVVEFEQVVADYVGAKYAVAVSSGTAALHAAMYAIEIGPGDEVIVSPMTFAATANCVVFQGGIPVFADVDPGTLLLDPAKMEEKITKKTKAIIGVDYAGQPCDWDSLRKIADRYGLTLVADGCHALGAEYKGRKVGSLADMTIFSFHPVKHITTGEGGMITTESEEYAEKMSLFRTHGITRDSKQFVPSEEVYAPCAMPFYYEMVDLGYNYRITDFQCALGISQLKKLPDFLKRRREIAALYDEALANIPGIEPLGLRADVLPAAQSAKRDILSAMRHAPCAMRSSHSYHLYVVKVDFKALGIDRAALFQSLRQKGIAGNVHYIPVHLHPFYRKKFHTGLGLCSIAEAAYEQIISLPMFPGMTDEDAEKVIVEVKNNVCG